MSAMESYRWHVVRTQPHAENKACAHLGRQGFETYLPRYLKKRRHARRVEVVRAALFPCYLFVAIDRQIQRWRCISSTVGVSHLVCNGQEPAPVPDSVIAALRGREDGEGLVWLPPQPLFAAGEKVRLLDGAFADCIGLFEGMKDIERVSVLLDLLGRKVRVLLDADSVAAA
ncbi:MAG TPA: transcriptional activator RfaH [Xanthobacteraceae bacterium]|nr:transcriptional activator RfaH [Xanthobacteraceae bacterium]